jgi:hypothetical protein
MRTLTATSRYRWSLHYDGQSGQHQQRALAVLREITEDVVALGEPGTYRFQLPAVEDEHPTVALPSSVQNLLHACWAEEPIDPWGNAPLFPTH